MAYQIKIQNFEGPFELLFHLIEKAEVDIYDIPIAEITNQYLEYIQQMESLDLEVASEFVVMAATLIQIKSKMLLPKETSPLDEISSDGEDPRAELVEKLLEYKKYKEVSEILKEKEELYLNILYKNAEIIDDIEEDEILLNVSIGDIVNAFNNIISRYKNRAIEDEKLEQQVAREEFTVDDKIEFIRNHIKLYNKTSFQELFGHSVRKLEVIITFLALLELIRLKEVVIYQDRSYGDIVIQGI